MTKKEIINVHRMRNIKNKGLIITTIIFFLIINTTYFWEFGGFGLPLLFLLIITYFVLVVVLVLQLYFAIKEKFKYKFRFFNIALLTTVLIMTFLFPTGFINFEQFESKNVLIAQRTITSDCSSTIKLKQDLTFVQQELCFGAKEIKGTYQISNDTIYFLKGKEILGYEFAIVKELEFKKQYSYALQLFKDKNDTIGYSYYTWSSKNDLKDEMQQNGRND